MQHSTDAGGLGIDQYAEVMAYLRYFAAAPRGDVLAYLRLAPREFDVAEERWAQAREAELGLHQTAISTRFVLSFASALERIQTEKPRLPSTGSAPLQADLQGQGRPPPGPGKPSDVPEVGATAPAVFVTQAPSARSFEAPPFVDRPDPAKGSANQLGMTAGPSIASPASSLPFRSPFAGAAAERADAGNSSGPFSSPVSHSPVSHPAPELDTTAALGDASPSLPTPPGVPSLTLEQYTSLRVELHLYPKREPEVLARYGLSPGTKASLLEYWNDRFAVDPNLRLLFGRHYAQYVAWLRANPGAGLGPPDR